MHHLLWQMRCHALSLSPFFFLFPFSSTLQSIILMQDHFTNYAFLFVKLAISLRVWSWSCTMTTDRETGHDYVGVVQSLKLFVLPVEVASILKYQSTSSHKWVFCEWDRTTAQRTLTRKMSKYFWITVCALRGASHMKPFQYWRLKQN